MVFDENPTGVGVDISRQSEAPERLAEENFPAIILEPGEEETASQMKTSGFWEINHGMFDAPKHQFIDRFGNIAMMYCTNEPNEEGEATDGTEAMLTQPKPKPEPIYEVESFHKNHFEKDENVISYQSLIDWGLQKNSSYFSQQGDEEYITHDGNRVAISWRGNSGQGRVIQFYEINENIGGK
jgi:hypothetical protein